jgi:hypothetical protein
MDQPLQRLAGFRRPKSLDIFVDVTDYVEESQWVGSRTALEGRAPVPFFPAGERES